MAILLQEEGLYDRCRIYATDINEAVLQRAKDGIFPLNTMQENTANYIAAGGTGTFSGYYTARYDYAMFRPSLRENVVFAQHNLVTDASFNHFNVIFCRNVLIYFNNRCRTACSSSSSTAWRCSASSASARRRRSATRTSPTTTTRSMPRSGCTGGSGDDARTPAQLVSGHERSRAAPATGRRDRSPELIVDRLLARRHARAADHPQQSHATTSAFRSRSRSIATRNRTKVCPRTSGGRRDLKVVDAEDKQWIQPGHVYLAPADYHLLIERNGRAES